MPLTIVNAPSEEPLTAADAIAQLRLDTSQLDGLLDARIVAAREYAERYTSRALTTRTYDWTLDAFADILYVPMPPLQSVTSITYIDTAGTTQTLATSEYTVDTASQPGRILPAHNKSWPSTRGHVNDVTIRFVAGYGAAAAVPYAIKAAMLLIVGEFDKRREHAIVGAPIAEVPLSALHLLDMWRMHHRVGNI